MMNGFTNYIRLIFISFFNILSNRFFGAHLNEITESQIKEIQNLKILCLENDSIVSRSKDIFLPLKGYEYTDKSMSKNSKLCKFHH